MVHSLGSLAAIFLAGLISVSSAAKNPKRGLAFAESDHSGDIKLASASSSVVSWVYDWGQSPKDYIASSGIPYVPMQWGTDNIQNFASLVKQQGAKTILGFNEPDFASQSNLTAAKAAELWKQYIDPLKNSGVRLGSPAITNAPSGRPWLSDFLKACSTCKIDFINIHWYGEGIGNFYDYLWQVHGQFPTYPVWVTEYASTSSVDADVADFLNSTARYMDTLDWVERYSWFAFFVSPFSRGNASSIYKNALQRKEANSHYNLLDANGNLGPLGKIYMNS